MKFVLPVSVILYYWIICIPPPPLLNQFLEKETKANRIQNIYKAAKPAITRKSFGLLHVPHDCVISIFKVQNCPDRARFATQLLACFVIMRKEQIQKKNLMSYYANRRHKWYTLISKGNRSNRSAMKWKSRKEQKPYCDEVHSAM